MSSMDARTDSDLLTVGELTRTTAENHPNNLAFADADRELTWAEFDSESDAAAQAFREHISQGDRIAFLCESSVDHMVALNGAFKAGAIPTNLHVRASPETSRYCIDTVRPRMLVVDEVFAEHFANRVDPLLTTDIPTIVTIGEPRDPSTESLSSFISDQPTDPVDAHLGEDDIAAIWWTSGTTGRPKGWCHSYRSMLLKAMKSSTTADRNARRLIVLSPGFAAWWGSVMGTILTGGAIVFRRDWSPESVPGLIEEESLTHVGLVATMWREILGLEDLDEYDLSSLVRIGSTGETLDPTTISRLEKEICDTIRNGYASTELLGTSITNDEMKGDRIESVGKPIIGQQLRIVEEGGDPDDRLEPGEVGEIIIRGPDAPVWAWNDTEKVNASFQKGWWYSGDLGYRDEDGYLYLEGRSDFMITSKGMKVFPAPIEERLNTHPQVEESVVVGVEDDEYGQRVTAIVHRTGSDVTDDDLDEWCLKSDEIARFERPRRYVFIDASIPRTASGKLDRSAAMDDFLK